MDAKLFISSSELRDDQIYDLTMDLAKTINSETDIEAEMPKGKAEAGDKGEPITIGIIALSLIKAGAIPVILAILKPILDGDRSIRVKIKRSDGAEVEIDTRSGQIDKTMNSVLDLLGKVK